MKVYKTCVGFKIFGLLFSIPIIIVCTYILLVPFIPVPPDTIMAEMQNSWPTPGYLFYLIPMCLIGINILALIILVACFMNKVIITNNSIIVDNLFIRRELYFYEIENFDFDFLFVYIKPKKSNKKKLNINFIGLDKSLDLIKTLRVKLHNKS